VKKAVFALSVPESAWVREILPDVHPGDLPLAGMTFAEYALEWAETLGFEEAVLLDFGEPGCPAARLAARPSGNIRVSRREVPAGVSPERAARDEGDGATLVRGLVLAGFAVDSVPAWHRLNMKLLGSGEVGGVRFVLPGYSAEPGAFIGRNVGMERGVEVKKPVLLQDGSWCARNVRLDGFCAVGRHSFVGARTRLERTIVGNDTYVGTDLELVDKIVVGHRVIDGPTGVWTDIGERGVAGALRPDLTVPRWLSRLAAAVRGRSCGRRR